MDPTPKQCAAPLCCEASVTRFIASHSTLRWTVALFVCICWPLLAAAQSVLYVTTGNGNESTLYTVDPQTAQAVLVGDVLAGSTGMVITGMAFQPGSGVLYGVTGSETGPSRQLVTIDPQTAQATLIGGLGVGSSDISFAADGTLYSWTTRGGPLGIIDLITGLQAQVGAGANGTQGNGLAFAPDGTLYLAGPTGPGDLYTVNPTTGAITSVATLVDVPLNFGNVNAMASDANGLLYAVGRSSAELVTINPVTGAFTSVGTLSFGEADALAFFVVPEPATWVLVALGLGGGLLVRRRGICSA